MRVLLVRLSSFGDVVFTLPAARALKEAWPGTRLAWAVEEPFAPLLRGAAYVDEVLIASTRRWRRAPLAQTTREELRVFLAAARAFAPDIVVDAQGLFKSAWATLLVPARRKIGFGLRSATETISCLACDEHVDTPSRHVADRALALARYVTGAPLRDRRPDVAHLVAAPPGPDLEAWLSERGGAPFALLQPFSSVREKEWRDADVLDFARRSAGAGLLPVVRWGPAEKERAEALVSASAGVAILAPPTDPAGTAALAARAALFVGADTGPTHLAAAAGVPTVALFGPTDPGRFGPIGPNALVWPLPGYNEGVPELAPGPAARDVFTAARSLLPDL